MTSITRRLRRKKWGKDFYTKFPRPEQASLETPTGYAALHPTKGWRKVSATRIAIAPLLNYLLTGGRG